MTTISLALGAGGARGLAHIHVLRALEELGIRPVAVSGGSVDRAVVGVAVVDEACRDEAEGGVAVFGAAVGVALEQTQICLFAGLFVNVEG